MRSSSAAAHNSEGRFFGVQILRALAATLVLMHHVLAVAQARIPGCPHPNDGGAFGVDIFFPISGFVMYMTANGLFRRGNPPGAWKTFLERRVLRVVPMYYVLTVLKIALFLVLPGMFESFHLRPWHTVATFLFLPAMANGVPLPILIVGWTLSYEMLFYAILTGLLAWRLPLLRGAALVIGALAVVGMVIPHRWGGLTYLADTIELEFLAGMLIAAAVSYVRRIPVWVAGAALPAALLAALVPHWGQTLEFTPWRALWWGVPGAAIVLATVALEAHVPFHRMRTGLLLGDASYALYLTHLFVVPFLGHFLPHIRLSAGAALAVFAGVGLPCALLVAVGFHLGFEIPVLRRLSALRLPWSVHSADTAA